jgi:Tol biopolymer transport system component
MVIRPDGSQAQVVATDGVVAAHLAWSPDGQFLAYVAGESSSMPDDADCSPQPPDPAQVDWERRAFCATTIRLIDTATWDNRAMLPPTTGGAVEGSIDPAWSPDGKSLVFASLRDGQAGIWAIDIDTSNLRQVAQSTDLIRYPVWLRQ